MIFWSKSWKLLTIRLVCPNINKIIFILRQICNAVFREHSLICWLSFLQIWRDICQWESENKVLVFKWQTLIHLTCEHWLWVWRKISHLNSDQVSHFSCDSFCNDCYLFSFSNCVIINLFSFLSLFNDSYNTSDFARFIKVFIVNFDFRKCKINVYWKIKHSFQSSIFWLIHVFLNHADLSILGVVNINVKNYFFQRNLSFSLGVNKIIFINFFWLYTFWLFFFAFCLHF